MASQEKFSKRKLVTFITPSLIGVFFFMVPITCGERTAIPVAQMARILCEYCKEYIKGMVMGIFILSALLAIVVTFWKPRSLMRYEWLVASCKVTYWELWVRIASVVLSFLVIFQWGPCYIWSEDTGKVIFSDLLPILFMNLLIANLLAPLLFNFGLLAFIGSFMQPIMRFFFQLPGHVAVNCISSWIGDGTMGTMIALRCYQEGKYTMREAGIVVTCFSVVSIAFCVNLLSIVDLEAYFGAFYFTVIISSLLAAIIMPYLPPLSQLENTYIGGHTKPAIKKNQASATGNIFYRSISAGIVQASHAPKLHQIAKEVAIAIFRMAICVLPGVMVVGTLSLVVGNQTPFFDYLGMPFVPLLKWMGIQGAPEASRALFAGFADVMIPSLLVEKVPFAMTRFIIVCLSVTQIVFISELGAIVLGSRLKLDLKDLIVIFLLRTIITLPIIVCCAHKFFG